MKTKKESKTKTPQLEVVNDIFMVEKNSRRLVSLKPDIKEVKYFSYAAADSSRSRCFFIFISLVPKFGLLKLSCIISSISLS